jgi:hypothetical protein
VRSKELPLFPMPSLLSTSRTSFDPETSRLPSFLDWIGRRASSGSIDETRSEVSTLGARPASAVLDMLLRPESASRRSVTPTPRLAWFREARERFSMCISAGAILTIGFGPSPRIWLGSGSAAVEVWLSGGTCHGEHDTHSL